MFSERNILSRNLLLSSFLMAKTQRGIRKKSMFRGFVVYSGKAFRNPWN
jgi:hypothetical protein